MYNNKTCVINFDVILLRLTDRILISLPAELIDQITQIGFVMISYQIYSILMIYFTVSPTPTATPTSTSTPTPYPYTLNLAIDQFGRFNIRPVRCLFDLYVN
eukprot:TRINITY_DN3501_c1_g2_i2.p4 TRINITY_DN3501_c1_g2~~TRINITY_DN3501_c1_g2_i2.p4  ORF type:complete len:102 (+),score=2.64 TRINITY_DN3501_c1_g2_i2:499-804(+)